MKLSLRELFGFMFSTKKNATQDEEELEYDKSADFYFTNIINSLILFSFRTDELEKLSAPTFDPIFELESEIDYAFTPVCFETVFRNNLIDDAYKDELLDFKKETDEIPSNIWDWEFIDNHPSWVNVRQKANSILDKLGIKHRIFNEDYLTVYDSSGNIIHKGDKV